MATRIRWYSLGVEPQLSARAFAQTLERAGFTKRRGTGFVVDESRRNHVTGRFIERRVFVEKVKDPVSGREEAGVSRVLYFETRLRFEETAPQLEFIDSPRSYSTAIAQLAVALESKASISPVDTDIRACIRGLENVVRDLRVLAMEVSGVAVDSNVSARILFRGGEDVRRAMGRFLSDREPRVERATIDWLLPDGDRIGCSVGRGGFRCERESLEVVRTALRAVAGEGPVLTKGQAR